MKILNYCWISVALAFSSTPAANAQSGFAAGLTSLPCSEIVAKSNDASLKEWANFWIKGVWTGLNVAAKGNGVPTKNLSIPANKQDALAARILAYCYENQDAVLIDIALQFYAEMKDH